MILNQQATVWANDDQITEKCVGRMTREDGKKVEIIETDWITDKTYQVFINGNAVTEDFDCRTRAVRVAKWWMDGCHA